MSNSYVISLRSIGLNVLILRLGRSIALAQNYHPAISTNKIATPLAER